jgi:RNA polymerase sigma-70 factor (ECF subfamily)
MAADPDVELLLAWRAGDSEAGSALLQRQFNALYRFFRSKADPDLVNELIQRTMLTCVEQRDAFRGDARFSTYVYAVARSVLVAHYRQRGRDAGVFDPSAATADQLVASPSVDIVRRQEHRLLLEGMRRLPLDHQMLLELYYWESMRGPQLAEVFGVPEGTVRTRLRRARELLRSALAELETDAERVSATFDDLAAWAESLRHALDAPAPGVVSDR